jgi:hypothetical protein
MALFSRLGVLNLVSFASLLLLYITGNDDNYAYSWLFDNALLFFLAASFGIFPDVISTLYYKKKKRILSIPLLPYIHTIHRGVHWFETEHPDGSCSSRFPNKVLLLGEALFTCGILFALFR